MAIRIRNLLIALFLFNGINSSIAQKLGFEEVLERTPDITTTFCLPINDRNLHALENSGLKLKFQSENWAFITTTPRWIKESIKEGSITDFYFENAPPSLFSDSARGHHFVNEVHAGAGGLPTSYTGNGVIIGFVDTGIDFNHDDFKDANGNTRVIRYWDQTMPDNASSPPNYGYGFIWDSTDINNMNCTSMDMQAHGTTVAGQACGNGMANGSNKGMAPDASIIMVESDFTRPNWTLTVADACDYIFKVADTLGLPAVVNLSVGTYYGSHDGNDPASEMIESLLDAKSGRIVVAAAGNSGNQGKYHQQGNPTASDTNFVWLVNNPSSTAIYGANTIYLDLWSDTPDAIYDFALGADTQGPQWDFRGRSNFHGATSSIGTPIFDTIWNGSNRLATVRFFTEYVGSNYHMEMIADIDSVNYLYRFETTGAGKYDLWSGEWQDMNDLYTAVPSLAVFPDSIKYVMPDSLQTVVSSWNCSEKVISVANMRNRLGHIDRNYNQYYPSDMTPPGKLSPNSSKGPSRHNVVKPDISAAGDVSLGSGPLWVLSNPVYNFLIDSGGMHLRNGGTSMAAPVVAGIGALYLERCSRATFQDYIDDLTNTAYTDQYTGTVPNNAYGYGKAHALNTLLEQSLAATPTITNDLNNTLSSSSSIGYEWYLDGSVLAGETGQTLTVTPPYGTYHVLSINADGCSALSDPLVVAVNYSEIKEEIIKIYPNPVTSSLTITTNFLIKHVHVTDLDGKQIELERISSNVYGLNSISKGVYTLIIETEDDIYRSKIIKM